MKEFKLPDEHRKQLRACNKMLTRISKQITEDEKHDELSEDRKDLFEDALDRLTNKLAGLSMDAFRKRDQIRTMYEQRYPDDKALADKLWQDTYYQLHKPYDSLKNRCWILKVRLRPELGEEVIKLGKRKLLL
jgi:hypothetical protein